MACRRAGHKLLASLLVLLLAACATPIGVLPASPDSAARNLSANVLSSGELSSFSQNVLRLHGLSAADKDEEEAALHSLHEAAARAGFPPGDLFALSELSYARAQRGSDRALFVASAAYAYGFLFPDAGAGSEPDPFDPKVRWAADIYNRALTRAFASADGSQFEPRADEVMLPFGSVSIAFDQADLLWQGRRFVNLVPMADLEIRGLRNRYRLAGIGAPLAAGTVADGVEQEGFQVGRRIKVPVTALLRFEGVGEGLAAGTLSARLELHPEDEGDHVTIAGRSVPLESEPSAALAYSLSDPEIWSTGLRGFLIGTLLQSNPTRLTALQPYRPSRIPVVFVHGTASVAARWAEMVNDLIGDAAIRDRFQFWFFAYESGNPIPYSALLLRDALTDAVKALDPSGQDPALRRMVLIGHSQGGLLAKMVSIESGSTLWDEFSGKPLEEMSLSPATRELLGRALFVEPMPGVGRVIFIATPQRGSYVAGWSLAQLVGGLVKIPLNVVSGVGELLTQEKDELRFDPTGARMGSVYGMTPNSPFILGLSKIPVSQDVAAHSIIAVKGDGPAESGGDGVVRYESAHIEEARSELVVRSGHSVQSRPETIAEVRRILLLHAAEACEQAGLLCASEALATDPIAIVSP